VVYPLYYDQLLALTFPGPQLLLLRNALLVALWVLLISLPFRNTGGKATPA
jgi:hypothetical protein